MLRIGTSGWSYPSGKGTWNGLFYPPKTGDHRRARGFDELSWYAEHFDTVEVNSSFYGPPRPEVSRGWVRRTPAGFEFSVKLHQQFTHPEMYRKGALGRLPEASPEALAELARVTSAAVDRFRAGLDPIAEAGKLGVLLVQYPSSFHDTDANREYLGWLLRTFGEYPVAVELRHRSWSDRIGETLTLLNAFGAAWVQIDEPKFRFSIQQNWLPNLKSFYYARLHGRHAAQWWRHESRDDRYDYLYSTEELRPFGETARAAEALVRKAYLYLNNHFAAKAVVNAVMLKQLTGEPVRGTYPQALVDAYPELKGLVGTAGATPVRLL